MRVIGEPATPSPRKRFWLSCLLVPIAASLILFGAPLLDPAPAFVWSLGCLVWLCALYWVLSAHAQQAGGYSQVGLVRLALVAVGLTFGIILAAVLTAGIIAMFLVPRHY